MRGTVIKRGKRWTFVVDVGRDEEGKRLRKWQGGFPTRKAAQTALTAYLSKINAGGDPFPEQITVKTYMDRWFGHQETRVRPTTLARYKTLVNKWVSPVIGDLMLDRIRPAHVQDILDRMMKAGRAPRTAIQARAVLGAAFRQAVAWGLIQANPVQAVRPPKAQRPQLEVPTREQVIAFIEAAKGEQVWEIPMMLAATTGARRSEVLGIRWPAVDLLRGKVRIVKTLQKTPNGGAAFADPKTSRARREIVLPASVAVRLREHHKAQMERRIALGPEWQDFDLVCEQGDGSPIHPDSFSEAFKRIARKAGLSPMTRLHDLRHAVATMMLEGGEHPAIASAVLGHSSPAFTMSVYQHVLDGMTDKAARTIGDALGL